MVINDITLAYDKYVVIDGLSISINKGSMTTIIGPNGCGKSTLLKAMSRVLEPLQGQILLDGKDLFSFHTKTLARKLAFLPQTQEILHGLTVFELISFGRYPYQKGLGKLTKNDIQAIENAMSLTQVDHLREKSIDQLSGGQRQRVWIAMSLAQETEMIFLDEPTTYLDISHQLDIMHLLRRLNQDYGKTVVMVLHDINQAAFFSDDIIAMKDGKVIRSGSSGDVITKSLISDVFKVSVDIMLDKVTDKPVIYNIRQI